RLVDRIEPLGLARRELADTPRHQGEAALLDHRDDLPDGVFGDGVRLDDEERPLGHDEIPFSLRSACMVTPSRAGLGARRAPAAVSAAIFSAAVPLPPAMIAPA